MEHPVFENVHNTVRDAECPPLENARQNFRWALGLTQSIDCEIKTFSLLCEFDEID